METDGMDLDYENFEQQKSRREIEFPREKCTSTLKSRMKCSFCSSSFKNYFRLSIHLKTDHRADIRIRCKICQKLFVHTMTFHKHLLNHVPGVTKELLDNLDGGYLPDNRKKQVIRDYVCERKQLLELEIQKGITERGTESSEQTTERKDKKSVRVSKSKHLRERQNQIKKQRMKNCEQQDATHSAEVESILSGGKQKRKTFICVKCDAIFKNDTELLIHSVSHVRIDTRINCSECSNYFIRPEDYFGHPCRRPEILSEPAPSLEIVPESPGEPASPIYFEDSAPSPPDPDDAPSPEQPSLQIISVKSLQTLIDPENSVPSPPEMAPNSPDPPSPPAFFDDLARSPPIPDQSSSEIPVESVPPAIAQLLKSSTPTPSHGTVLVQSTLLLFNHTPRPTIVIPESDPSKRANPTEDNSSDTELDQEIHKILGKLDLQETYDCDKCNEKFKFKLEWVNHLLSHGGATDWYCRQCGKKVKTKTSLYKHIRRVHNDPEGAQVLRNSANSFKCDLCPKQFTARSLFNFHRISHPENRNSLCQYCGQTFPSKNERMAHIHSVHTRACDSGVNICEICGKPIKGRGMKKHMEYAHSDTQYMCEDCGHICKNQKNLEIHKRSHLPEKPVACKFCSFRSLTSAERLQHLTYKHLGPDGFQEIDLQPGAEKLFKCIECDKEYTTQVALDEHRLFHGDRTYQCAKCPWKSFTNYHHRAHAITFHSTGVNNMVKPIPWTCKFCGESIPNRFELYVHETSKCSLRPSHIQDPEPSQQREQDPEHIRKTDKGWQCDLCKKTYKNKTDVLYHHRAVHVGTHRFVCEVCGRGTNSKGNMNAHMRQHGGAYECHICGGERFKSWQDLEEHKEEKHGVTTIFKSGEKRGSRLKGQSLRECKLLGALVGLDGEEGYRAAIVGSSQP